MEVLHTITCETAFATMTTVKGFEMYNFFKEKKD